MYMRCSAEGRASEFERRENRGIREGWMRRRKETQKDGGKRGRKIGKAREREIRPETAGTRKRERENGGKEPFRDSSAPSIPGGFYIQLVFPILLEVLSERSEDEKGRDGDG